MLGGVLAALPLAAARDGVSALQGGAPEAAIGPPRPLNRSAIKGAGQRASVVSPACAHRAPREGEARANRNYRAAARRRQASQWGGGGWGRGYEPTLHCLALASWRSPTGNEIGRIRPKAMNEQKRRLK